MNIAGATEVRASVGDVWAFLLDPNRVAACIPGAEQVRQVDPQTFTGVVTAAVGPLSGHFAFRTVIDQTDPPTALTAWIDGTDDVSRSTVRTRLAVRLEELAPDRSELRYEAVVTTEGRLAIVGDMILRATAGAMFAQFARRLGNDLAGDAHRDPRLAGAS